MPDLALGDEDDDLALGAHRERVDGVGEVPAEQRRDALTFEEALHHDGLRLTAAVHLHEPAPVGRGGTRPRVRGSEGKGDDLTSSRHRPILQSTLQSLPVAAPVQAHDPPEARGLEMSGGHDDLFTLQAFQQGPPRVARHLGVHVGA